MTLTDLAREKDISPARLWRAAIAAAVLFLSFYLASRASLTYLILLVGMGAVLVLVRMPELGLVGMVVSALLIPFSLSTGTQTSVHLAVLLIPLLFAIYVAGMLRRRKLRFVPSRTNLPLLLFVISAVISFLMGNLSWNYFASTASLQSQLGGLAIFLFSAAVFLLVGNLVKDLKWLKWLTGLFLVLGSGYLAGNIIPGLGWLAGRYPTGSTGSIFWVWISALAGGQIIFNRSLSDRTRLLLIALVAAAMFIGWFEVRSWLSGWIPPLVVLLVLVSLYSWRLGLVVTLVGASAILIRTPELVTALVAVKQYSIDTRFDAWQIMFDYIIPINPLLGLGPANYYFYTPLFPILGYYVSFNSHNQYLDILAQTGMVGMIVFGWLMLAIGKLGWSLRYRVTDEFARGYLYGSLAGLVGSLYAGVHGDWFIPFVYNVGLAGFRSSMLGWLFLGGLVAIEQIINRETQVPPISSS